MISESVIIITIVFVNFLIDTMLVLAINPRMSAERIKKTILTDQKFIRDMVREIMVSVNEQVELSDPIFDRFRMKLQASSMNLENLSQNPMEIKKFNSEIGSDLQGILGGPFFELLGEYFPKAKEMMAKNPRLIEYFLDKMGPFIEKYYKQ